jgi:hypothetical protein
LDDVDSAILVESYPFRDAASDKSSIVAMVAPTTVVTAIAKYSSKDCELLNKLRNDRSLVPAIVEECIRLHVYPKVSKRQSLKELVVTTWCRPIAS